MAHPRHRPGRGRADGGADGGSGALTRGLRPPERFYLNYPHELSGGQQQRVAIARALVLDPEVIVADEPVSSLDASVRGEILKLLLGLRNDLDIAMLVVTHDLGLAWTIADRVAVMYLGRIVEIGPPRTSCRDDHRYESGLNCFPSRCMDRPASVASRPTRPGSGGLRFHTRCRRSPRVPRRPPARGQGTGEISGSSVVGRLRGVHLARFRMPPIPNSRL